MYQAMALLYLAAVLVPAVALELLPLQLSKKPQKARWAQWSHCNVSAVSFAPFNISPQVSWDRNSTSFSFLAVARPEQLLELDDVLYTVETKIAGTSAQLVVDTGSSDIWTKESVLVPGDGRVKVRTLRRQGHLMVPELLLKFGMGSVLGVPMIVKDFCVAGICVEDQDVVMGLQIRDMTDLASFEGLLGLALPKDSQNPWGTPFVGRLQHMNRTLAFAMLLGGEQPFIAFGSRKELLDGHHHRKLPVYGLKAGFTMWTVAMGLNITDSKNGQPLLAAEGTRLSGFGALDSGSTLLVLPEALFMAVVNFTLRQHAMCWPSNPILCLCDMEINELSFTFGDLMVNFTKEDLLLPVSQGVCRLNIMLMPPAVRALPVMILGQVFLRKIYAVFDPITPAVWIAEKRSPKVDELQKVATTSMPDLALIATRALLALIAVAVAAAFAASLRRRRCTEEAEYMAL